MARTFFSQWSLRVPQQRDSFDFMTTHHCEKRAWLKKCWLLGSSADPELPAPAERVWKVRIARLSQKAMIQHTPTDCLTTSRMLPTIEPGRFSQSSVVLKLKMAGCCSARSDHCKKTCTTRPTFHDGYGVIQIDDWLDGLPRSVSPELDPLDNHIRAHRGEWFVFLHDPEVPPTNNHAEQMLRPAVITRKVGGCNKTLWGA